jgi:hypothetical protein
MRRRRSHRLVLVDQEGTVKRLAIALAFIGLAVGICGCGDINVDCSDRSYDDCKQGCLWAPESPRTIDIGRCFTLCETDEDCSSPDRCRERGFTIGPEQGVTFYDVCVDDSESAN